MERLHACRLCPRLGAYRAEQQRLFPEYHNLPVAAFGSTSPRLLIVGLAPGLHGANATGRPFTGDASGQLLFETLHRFGFASAAESRHSRDEMQLHDCRITNAVKCVPPQNRPNGAEIKRCNSYLQQEIRQLSPGAVILALGTIAHRAVLSAVGLRQSRQPFAHLAEYSLPDAMCLLDSYHCSRYNINTGRLTRPMFERVFARIVEILQ